MKRKNNATPLDPLGAAVWNLARIARKAAVGMTPLELDTMEVFPRGMASYRVGPCVTGEWVETAWAALERGKVVAS